MKPTSLLVPVFKIISMALLPLPLCADQAANRTTAARAMATNAVAALESIASKLPEGERKQIEALKKKRNSDPKYRAKAEKEDVKNCERAITTGVILVVASQTGDVTVIQGASGGGTVVVQGTPETIAAAAVSSVLAKACCEDGIVTKLLKEMPADFGQMAKEFPEAVDNYQKSAVKHIDRIGEKAKENLKPKKIEKYFLRPIGKFVKSIGSIF